MCKTKGQDYPSGKDSSNWKGGSKASNARHKAKRRGLGNMLLDIPFEGAEAHHITHNSVVFIPSWVHYAIHHNIHTGRNMHEINILALDFLVKGF